MLQPHQYVVETLDHSTIQAALSKDVLAGRSGSSAPGLTAYTRLASSRNSSTADTASWRSSTGCTHEVGVAHRAVLACAREAGLGGVPRGQDLVGPGKQDLARVLGAALREVSPRGSRASGGLDETPDDVVGVLPLHPVVVGQGLEDQEGDPVRHPDRLRGGAAFLQ